MLSFLARHKTTAVGFMTLIFPLVLLWQHGKVRADLTIYETTLLRFTSPAQTLMSDTMGAIKLVWTDYIWVVDVQQENRRLRTDNELLQGHAQDIAKLKRENARLKALLKFKGKRPDLVTVAARVVAKDISAFHRVLKVTISAGADHGVRRGQAVITPVGVVGHVERTVGKYAEVKLAVDSGSRISVNVANSDTKGVVSGAGDRNTFLASFETSDSGREIKPGDLLVTNGEGRRFAKGLVVGFVDDGRTEQTESGLRFPVVPAVNFSSVEFVLIVTSEVERIPEMDSEADR